MERIAELEVENAELRHRLATGLERWPLLPAQGPVPSLDEAGVAVPDPGARIRQLVAQGLGEQDAEAQAAYEARTRVDNAAGAR